VDCLIVVRTVLGRLAMLLLKKHSFAKLERKATDHNESIPVTKYLAVFGFRARSRLASWTSSSGIARLFL
jgi:hypothetical protein